MSYIILHLIFVSNQFWYNNKFDSFERLIEVILLINKFNREVVMFVKIIIMKCCVKKKIVDRWELDDTTLKDF